MKNKIIIIGMCIWIPIFIFSRTHLAEQILNPPENWILGLSTVIVMIIGIAAMLIGILK